MSEAKHLDVEVEGEKGDYSHAVRLKSAEFVAMHNKITGKISLFKKTFIETEGYFHFSHKLALPKRTSMIL